MTAKTRNKGRVNESEMTRPTHAWAVASGFYKGATKREALDTCSARIHSKLGLAEEGLEDPREMRNHPMTRWLYQELQNSEQKQWESYLLNRIASKGWDTGPFLPGLRSIPRSIPQQHRWFLFRTHLNAHMTTHRLASAGCGEETQCPLCGTGPDTYEHLHECNALDETKRDIETSTTVSAGAWEHATLFFRKRIDGAIFALVLAVYAAAWTIRGYRRRVGGSGGGGPLKDTIRKLLDCPWLTGCATNSTKKERRKRRIRPPKSIGRAVRYRSDGASRRAHGESIGKAGYGAAVWKPGESGEPHAWCRASIGRASNNVAEYEGLKEGMRRAARAGDPCVVFEVDSFVVAKHMAHRNAWACKTKALKEHYKTCRALGQKLTEKGVKWEVRHIYREFNQTADGLANAALDDENGNGPSQHW